MLRWLERRIKQWMEFADLPVWYCPEYRLPLSCAEGLLGIEPRRADFTVWYLLQTDVCNKTQLRKPSPMSFEHLQRVHTKSYLESLWEPNTMADMIGCSDVKVPSDEVIKTVRLACGGTLEAARWVLQKGGPALNLLGGMHGAGPDFGAGLCPLNDIACTVAALEHEGFSGKIAVVDLDAHAPVGTSACLGEDPKVWIGSISTDDTELQGVDGFVVPRGCTNEQYKVTFGDLLAAMPAADLVFVIAGGDVLSEDRLGGMNLDIRGIRKRDQELSRHLGPTPSVWLPGGGYHRDSWRVLAGTALVLAKDSTKPIADSYDPMGERFAQLSRELDPVDLPPEGCLSADDVAQALRIPGGSSLRLLGYYSEQNIDFALVQFGIIPHLRRLGYRSFRTVIDRSEQGDRFRLFGKSAEETSTRPGPDVADEHLLVECLLDTQTIDGDEVLYVHWLTLRNPLAAFSSDRRKLPGQEVPGLGLAREAGQMLIRIAKRLELPGVAYRPAWYHTAFAGRYHMRFADPVRQGQFEALMRDTSGQGLELVTKAMAQGRIIMDGSVYKWGSDPMVIWLDGRSDDREIIEKEKQRVHFELAEPAA